MSMVVFAIVLASILAPEEGPFLCAPSRLPGRVNIANSEAGPVSLRTCQASAKRGIRR
jgi:hypothetical protein